jgi:hypothetical protein
VLIGTDTAVPHKNGTWTGALGELQSGDMDILVTYTIMSLEQSKDFKFTTPINIQRYAAIMKRQTPMYIDIDSLFASVDITIYGIALAIFTFLLFVSWLHERLNAFPAKSSNSMWHLLLSLFPMNGQMWPNQTGVTRKVLMATCGFALLILSSLYQAQVAEQQLIPYPPPIVTLKEIENLITSGNAQLVVTYYTIME